jgi:hypothetical protein
MTALQCFATLIGTLQLARAVADSDPSQAILEHGVHTVLAQVGVHDHSDDLA